MSSKIKQELLEKMSKEELIEVIREKESEVERKWNDRCRYSDFVHRLTSENLYIPKHMTRYFYVSNNKIYDRIWYGDTGNMSSLLDDRCFKTKKQAEEYLQSLSQVSMFGG